MARLEIYHYSALLLRSRRRLHRCLIVELTKLSWLVQVPTHQLIGIVETMTSSADLDPNSNLSGSVERNNPPGAHEPHDALVWNLVRLVGGPPQ